jgi:hypothetical protein
MVNAIRNTFRKTGQALAFSCEMRNMATPRSAENTEGASMAAGEVDKDWFLGQLAQKGRSLRSLAAALHVDPAAVSRLFSGKRNAQDGEPEKIAHYLQVTTEDVLLHLGMDVSSSQRLAISANITEKGNVERMKETKPLPDSVLVRAHAAIGTGHKLLAAAQVRASKGALSIWDDAVLVFEEPNGLDPAAVGVLSVVKLRDGVQMIGHLDKARKTGEATIRTATGESKDILLQGAAPVLAVVL